MRSIEHSGVFKQAFAAFLISFIALIAITFLFPLCSQVPLCSLPAEIKQNALALSFEDPTSYDSRVFLLPLQPFMHIFMRFIPFFRSGNLAAEILSIFFAAWVSGLFILAAHHTGIKPAFARLFIIAYLTNVNTLQAVVTGSGVHILIFLLLTVYVFLAQWHNQRYWLALVWIGMGSALAVLSQFTSIFFFLLPVLAALVIAYKEKPANIYYTENAMWIMLTPILYVFIIRFLFGYIMYGDMAAFFRIESGVLPALANKQPILPPVLPRFAQFVPAFFSSVWGSYAPFTIMSAGALIASILRKKVFPAAFTLMAWLPLFVLYAANNGGFYDPALVIANFVVAAAPLLAFVSVSPLKKWRSASIILLSGCFLIWNISNWLVLFRIMP